MSEGIEAPATKVTCLLSARTGAKNPNIPTPSKALPLDSSLPYHPAFLLRQFTKNQISLQGFSQPDLWRVYKEPFLLLFHSLSLVFMKVTIL